MPVTKQTYTANAPWTATDMANLLSSAFIDAGLMTAWHDSFAPSSTLIRVLRIQHDAARTYGSCFYYFAFSSGSGVGNVGVSLASGWNPSGTPPINVPTGTQFLDYHRLPADMSAGGGSTSSTVASLSTTSNLFLDRYTSALDARQSWFVFRTSTARSAPFSILHKDTALHSWLDLNKGIISGFSTIQASAPNTAGFVRFRVQENIRRCLLIGSALRGNTNLSGGDTFHTLNYNSHCYFGVGTSTTTNNIDTVRGDSVGSGIPLPVAKALANPAYTTDYNPICTDLAWSLWTPTKLAADFGIYMHYADNGTAYGDKFIVQAGVNEWGVLQFANNSTVNDGASPAFVARIV